MSTLKKLVIFILIVASVLLIGCSKEQNTLPEVVLKGVPTEDVVSTIILDGFNLEIHKTYASVVSYTGEDKNLVVPKSAAGLPIKVIGDSAFRENEIIESIEMPSSLLIIGKYCFDGCSALKEVILNDGLETIDNYAFRNSGIEKCTLPDSVGKIGMYAFYGCSKLQGTLHIPLSLSEADKYVFYGCESLTSIEFTARFYRISEKMFCLCSSLTEVNIPSTVTRIDGYAFSNCEKLEKIVFTDSVTKVGEGIVVGSNNVTIYAPKGSAIAKNAEKNNYKLEYSK